MTAPLTPPAERAGLRVLLSLLGAFALVLAAVPLAVLVRLQYAPLVRADLAVTAAAERAVEASAPLLAAAKIATLLGDPLLMTAGAAVLAAVLVTRGRGRLALYVVTARIGALVLSQGLKLAVDRVRPVFDVPVATALGGSFPSGHTLGSSVFWTTTAVLLVPHVRRPRLLLAAAVAVPVVVAASRVLLGVHYLSDVVGGLLLGLGWAALCTAIFTAWRAEQTRRPVDPLRDGVGA